MIKLLLTMFERIGTVVAIAFVLAHLDIVDTFSDQKGLKPYSQAVLFFSLCAVVSIFTGYALNPETQSLTFAFTQFTPQHGIVGIVILWPVLSGLLFGYIVSMLTALVITITLGIVGGLNVLALSFVAFFLALLSGYVKDSYREITPMNAALLAGFGEILVAILVLATVRPYPIALQFIKQTLGPLIITSSLCGAIFIYILQLIQLQKERTISNQAEKILQIADLTIAPLRSGLTKKSALEVCDILYKELNVNGVALTNQTHILAQLGMTPGSISEGMEIKTQVTKHVIATGKIKTIKHKKSQQTLDLKEASCAIIAPLKIQNQTIGTLKLYYEDPHDELAHFGLLKGLSKLLSEQLEVGESERTLQLAKESEINALQAQINPHFLFNALNTINALIRTQPQEARTLISNLSDFIRGNLNTRLRFITLEEEISHLKSYLSIIEARFSDRITITYHIDPKTKETLIPPLTLQPLVENAINHGFKDKDEQCHLDISIQRQADDVEFIITDNGHGIPEARLKLLTHQEVPSANGTGIAVYNVSRRLMMVYGDSARIHIQSKVMQGTCIQFKIRTGGDSYVI